MRKFQGTHTALITPFTANRAFDKDRFYDQIKRQIAAGVQGIVVVGTTGESPTLDHDEHYLVIQCAVDYADRRAAVIAGTGSNSTEEAIALTKAAEKAGADASLQVAPYYNKPSQEGLFQHFSAIAKATDLPIILYNIPGRTGTDLSVGTVARIVAENKNVVGIKEASGSCDRVTELRASLGDDFTILSGDDSLTLPFMSVGADGVISVVSNALPAWVCDMVEKARNGKSAEAQKVHAKLYGFTKALFADGNPAGIKCAMQHLKYDTGALRLPLAGVSKTTRALILQELEKLVLL